MEQRARAAFTFCRNISASCCVQIMGREEGRLLCVREDMARGHGGKAFDILRAITRGSLLGTVKISRLLMGNL